MSLVKQTMDDAKAFQMKAFIETIIPQIQPYIGEFEKNIEDMFGEGENGFVAIMRKEGDGHCYVHILKVKGLSIDMESEETLITTIPFGEFITSALSGNIGKMMKTE